MSRNSSTGLIVSVLAALGLVFLGLILFQSAWLKMIQYLLASSQSTGLPVATSLVPTFSIATASGPVSPGVEAKVGNLGITVTRVVSPADSYLGQDAIPAISIEGKEYLLVDVKVRCLSATEKCHLTEFDFGVETRSGQDYAAELSGMFSNVPNLFEGGDIQPGKSLSGSLIFIVPKGGGLTLVYPRLFSFGGSAKLTLGQ